MSNLRTLFYSAIVFFILTAPTQASLIIRIDDVGVQPGFSEAIVDVWIQAAADDVLLNRFDFEFRIEPVPGTVTQLRFLDPQDDLQLDDDLYVFADGSVKRDGFPPIPPGSVSTVDVQDDTFRGGDISTHPTLFGDVTVTTTPQLLASLQVVPGPGAFAPQLGDSFTIRLVEGPNTLFANSDTTTIPFQSTPGTVSVVPEPSSLTLMGGLVVIGLVGYGWRRRRNPVSAVRTD